LPAWLERLVSVGIVATDPDVIRRQRCGNVAASRPPRAKRKSLRQKSDGRRARRASESCEKQ